MNQTKKWKIAAFTVPSLFVIFFMIATSQNTIKRQAPGGPTCTLSPKICGYEQALQQK